MFGWFEETCGSNYPVNHVWDRVLNELIDRHGVSDIGQFHCKVGKVNVWIGNYPYAYGSPSSISGTILPKYSTRKRLKKIIDSKQKEEVNKKILALLDPECECKKDKKR